MSKQSARRNVLIVSWGGGGNLPPLLAAGKLLAARDHHVSVLASAATRQPAVDAGFDVVRYRRARDPKMDTAFEQQAAPADGNRSWAGDRPRRSRRCGGAAARADDRRLHAPRRACGRRGDRHAYGLAHALSVRARESAKDLSNAGLLSVPVTIAILIVAFGALVAAGSPLLLGLSAVMAALGLLAIPSQFWPVDQAVSAVVLLIGLAVGVDYSLFYLKREREERASGRREGAALEAAAATSGRAVLISGLTVMTAMAGMFLTGDTTFESFAMATILVVAIAVLGSLTVLPALLSRLGDNSEAEHIPGSTPPSVRTPSRRSAGSIALLVRLLPAVRRCRALRIRFRTAERSRFQTLLPVSVLKLGLSILCERVMLGAPMRRLGVVCGELPDGEGPSG